MSKRILLIDDSPIDRRIFRRFAGRAALEFDLVEACTGREGITVCREQKPDAVVLDFRLPDMDGLAVLTSIREFYQGPVIFISGNPDASTMTNAFRAGAVTYLSKDLLTAENLGEALAAVLQA